MIEDTFSSELHEGTVFLSLPYCVSVVGRRVEIKDRRYQTRVELDLPRKPTDRQLMGISFNGKLRDIKDGSNVPGKQFWLYDSSCPPYVAWAAYASRLQKLGKWRGKSALA